MPSNEMHERIYSLFQKSVEAKMTVGEDITPHIADAAQVLVNTLLDENKIFVCGNGTSAALAQIFTASMIDRYEKERPSLPAIWLGSNVSTYTAIVSDHSLSDVYAKPLRALGQPGDALIVISSSGNSANLIQAISAAHEREMRVIALTGRDGGDISSLLDVNDVEICIGVHSRGRVHEVHLLSIFCLCDLIDFNLFGLG